jgi:membrane-associated phospholipid phosphatase
MPDTVAATAPRLPLLIIAGVAVLLLASTVALWAHYGTTVFYEMILAGLAACF